MSLSLAWIPSSANACSIASTVTLESSLSRETGPAEVPIESALFVFRAPRRVLTNSPPMWSQLSDWRADRAPQRQRKAYAQID